MLLILFSQKLPASVTDHHWFRYGVSHNQRQAIFWTSAGILLIRPPATNVNGMLIEIYTFSLKKMHLSGKWRPFCIGFWFQAHVSMLRILEWFVAIDNVITGPLFTKGYDVLRQISWSFEAARLDIIVIVSLWNLTGISTALLLKRPSNFGAIGKF